MAKSASSERLVSEIVESVQDVKGEHIKVLDLRVLDNVASDFFVVCQGNSNTQVGAICQTVEKRISKTLREKPIHTEGLENSEWVLMDYSNVVVHVFQSHIRERFRIEELWGDAKQSTVN